MIPVFSLFLAGAINSRTVQDQQHGEDNVLLQQATKVERIVTSICVKFQWACRQGLSQELPAD
jgi:hypothetical protein